MRILVIGAGAIGGYFGGRLLHAHRDVTFLVRPRRAAELERNGLVIRSPAGDLTLQRPPAVLAENVREPFDLILLSCKAYDLIDAVASFAPAVGPATVILPLLNGMAHLDLLDQRFGRPQVFGGLCMIAATLSAEGAVVHINSSASLTFGDRGEGATDRASAVAGVLRDAGFDAIGSEQIILEMWEKWVLLATMAGMTCLMRASVGDIVASPKGSDLMQALLEECRAIAEAQGYAPRPAFMKAARAILTTASPLTASMLRDMEGNRQIEADHIVGDLLLRRKRHAVARNEPSILQIAYTHLKAYEQRRAGQNRPAAPQPGSIAS